MNHTDRSLSNRSAEPALNLDPSTVHWWLLGLGAGLAVVVVITLYLLSASVIVQMMEPGTPARAELVEEPALFQSRIAEPIGPSNLEAVSDSSTSPNTAELRIGA